ncbi:MAG: hypothetical protein ABI823_16870 [Bryobacteraceae bacterium]
MLVREVMRVKLGALQIVGLVFLLLTLLLIWFSIKNFWTYSRMRTAEVTVLHSRLRMDLLPSPDSESVDTMIYTMRLDLRAEDGSGREMEWEGDAGKAAYPEEALEELEMWKPGSRHRVQMIRGNARLLRVTNLEDSPELEAGIGCLVAAGFFAMFSLAGVATLDDDYPRLKRFRWMKKLGVWTVFSGTGLLALIGWGLFTYFTVAKILTWKDVTAQRVAQAHTFSLVEAIPGVEITPAAKKKIEQSSYDLIEYEWNGRRVHGGMGRFEGVHDGLVADADAEGRYRFKIDPRLRWNLSGKLGWNSDFWIPFGMLLFFGVAFSGAGSMIRKSL